MTRPFHPLLLALYPTAALLAVNIEQTDAMAALRPAALSLALALVLTALLCLAVRDLDRAAALASLGLIVFFSYGHVYEVLKNAAVAGEPIGRHRYLAPFFAALTAFLGWRILRRRPPATSTRLLNIVSLVLVALPLAQAAIYALETGQSPRATPRLESGNPPDRLPDVYYILLDAYTRQDVLRSGFGVDNAMFLSALERLDFDVAACAQSNYAQTELTLASALNLDYLDRLGLSDSASRDRTALLFLIRESALRRFFEGLGYRIVAFQTGYAWSEWQDADVYLRPEGGAFDVPLTAFESLMIDGTALRLLTDAPAALPAALGGAFDGPVELHRRRVLYTLDKLERLPDEPGPKLVFAHIVAPHRPYVLAPDAESELARRSLLADFDPARLDGTVVGYRNQVLYLNDRLLPILEGIVRRSSTPPVVILQGDHGPDEATGGERMAILDALHLPRGIGAPLAEARTPINDFRFMLREVFDVELDPVEDRSFFSEYEAPFDFVEVPQACRGA